MKEKCYKCAKEFPERTASYMRIFDEHGCLIEEMPFCPDCAKKIDSYAKEQGIKYRHQIGGKCAICGADLDTTGSVAELEIMTGKTRHFEGTYVLCLDCVKNGEMHRLIKCGKEGW